MTRDISVYLVNKLAAYCESNRRVMVVDENTSLQQLELDSLALMELVYDLEDELDIVLEPELLSALQSVGDLVAAINHSRRSVGLSAAGHHHG